MCRENEPNINLELLDKVFIGTPHIAGYSADGKANATRMVLESLLSFLRKRNEILYCSSRTTACTLRQQRKRPPVTDVQSAPGL